MKKKVIIISVIVVAIILLTVGLILVLNNKNTKNAEETLKAYFSYIEQKNYEEMFNLVNLNDNIGKEEFLNRNKNIYEGIDAKNIQIEIKEVEKESSDISIKYLTKMNTSAGNVEFENIATLSKNKDKKYKIDWSSNLIFPELNNDYKVRVSKEAGKRGSILDRNGNILAEQGNISSVGIVPEKLDENKEKSIKSISELLGVSVEFINNELAKSWVKDDSFVPIKEISYDSTDLKQQLLQIPGIMINSKTDRVYPYKDATSHITGYVQAITADELQNMQEMGYNSNSYIGKTGLEKVYEQRLKGTNGVKIFIEDANGNEIKTIAETKGKDGENIKLTIDINLQQKLYNKIKNDKGFFVVINPKNGEILALVSTPSYDANQFILGMTNQEWDNIVNSEGNPLLTRFLESWCPGSTFKPITGAIGLTTGKLSENDEFNYTGLSWQKDSSWGNHMITTLTAYNGKKNLKNALVHSDNIYFAQAALKIGEDTFTQELDKIKFNEDIDFILGTSKSTYSNSEGIERESILADSGYGQGELLVNPVHMASIYSAFVNEGNMIKPYLEYKEDRTGEYLVENAFSKEAANIIKEDLIEVVESPTGTAHDIKIEGIKLAGKTGTAELKASKEAQGETLGWFNCFTVDEDINNPMLIVSMVEDGGSNGGSRYLKKIIRSLFE